ncbi:MAG: hypothetical protein V2A62_01275 [Candidatus Woesearchaeota archaeon]
MDLENSGYRWGIIFLRGDSRLLEKERLELMMEATVMYLQGEEERKVKSTAYEGRLYTQGKHDVIGCLSGQRFEAELEMDCGKVSLRFLVSEQTGRAKPAPAKVYAN